MSQPFPAGISIHAPTRGTTNDVSLHNFAACSSCSLRCVVACSMVAGMRSDSGSPSRSIWQLRPADIWRQAIHHAPARRH